MREGGGWAGGIRGEVSGLSTSLNTIPPPPRRLLPRILNKPAGEGPRGQAGPGGSAFVALPSTAVARQRGRGRGSETLSRGLTPRCIVRQDPPPPPGAATGPPRDPSQRLPPPAAPTSRSPDQGPDVESSPQPAAEALSTPPPPPPPAAASLRPQAGLSGPRLLRAGVRTPASPRPQRSAAGRAAPRRCPSGKPRLRASSCGAGSTRGRGPAGGQRLRGGRRACPRSPAEWRLLCDPSSVCGRQGCCSARSCCSSAPFQVGALSSVPVGREQARVAAGRGNRACVCVCCGRGGVCGGGADHRPLSPPCSQAGAAARLAGRLWRLSRRAPLGAALPQPRAAGPWCPLSTLTPFSSRHCPGSSRVLASTASPGSAPPARRGRRGRTWLYLYCFLSGSLATQGAPRFRAACPVCSAGSPRFSGRGQNE